MKGDLVLGICLAFFLKVGGGGINSGYIAWKIFWMLSEKRKGHMGFCSWKNINEGVSRCHLFYAQKVSAGRFKTQQIGVVSM